ncbi:MAG: ATP-binding protein [Saprospiraceae bacterium]|nr:ATP-binding protein [Saprospiraceae bacterium]
MASIAELLSAARRRSFVGREKEIELFQSQLTAPSLEFVLLYIYGAGGEGKTTLIKHLAELCAEHKTNFFTLDAREVEAHPAAFLESFRLKLGKNIHAGQDVFEAAKQLKGRTVLFIDTYEKISPIDDWVRTDFLPNLPASFLTVICGRNAPSVSWLSDAGWKLLMRALHLRSFSPSESEAYLRRRNIPEDKIQPILDFTHGHPLALSVVADIYEQFPDKHFSPDESPDVVRTLMQLFVRQVPSPMHRAALEVCAIVNLLTESLLAEVMGLEDASELFNWMCGLSFISIGKEGIYPHDIAREALCADLKWRHPDWNNELHTRSRQYYHRKLKEAGGEQQRKVLFDLIYLHRTNPVVKPFFEWQETGSFWVDMANASDIPVLREMVQHLEGNEGLAVFDYWANHPAAQLWVWRDGRKQANAMVLKINGHELSPEKVDGDVAARKLIDYLYKTLNLRQGEHSAIFRMWMAKDTHQQVSALQSSIFLTIVQYYFTPGLAISFLNVVQPEFWKPVLNYGDLHHLPDLDFLVNGVPFGFYMHDWRVRPPLVWLDLIGKRETGGFIEPESQSKAVQIQVLNEAEFHEQVGEALKHFHNSTQLNQNPLTKSKIVVSHTASDATDSDRIAFLKEKILEIIKEIEDSPIDGKYHRVLYRSFINPVGSQEKTADFLNMSFSTYRRYVAAGVQRVAELLWEQEIR